MKKQNIITHLLFTCTPPALPGITGIHASCLRGSMLTLRMRLYVSGRVEASHVDTLVTLKGLCDAVRVIVVFLVYISASVAGFRRS